MGKKKGKKNKGKKEKGGDDTAEISEKVILTEKLNELERSLRIENDTLATVEKEKKEAQTIYEAEIEKKDSIVKHLQRCLQIEIEKNERWKEKLQESVEKYESGKHLLHTQLKEETEDIDTIEKNLKAEKLTILGKLSLLKELDMGRDGLLQKRDTAERRLMEEVNRNEEALRSANKEYTKQRDNLENECYEKVQDIHDQFHKGTCENLTHVVKNILAKSLKVYEQLGKASDEGLELQEKNSDLKHKERLLRFQLELDDVLNLSLPPKIQTQEQELKELQEQCSNQSGKITYFGCTIQNYESMGQSLCDLGKELCEVQDDLKELRACKMEQNKFLHGLQTAYEGRKAQNSCLLSIIQSARDAFNSRLTRSTSEDDSQQRYNLLLQLVSLLDKTITLDADKDREKMKPDKDPVAISRKLPPTKVDACVQTRDILTKYVSTKELKCHFFDP